MYLLPLCLLFTQVSVSGQALVFVVRHQGWSVIQRAGSLTYVAFLAAQLGATLIGIFGFGGYTPPREYFEDCQFCSLSTGGKVRVCMCFCVCQARFSMPRSQRRPAYVCDACVYVCMCMCAVSQVLFWESGKVPQAQTESVFTASVIGCT